MSDRALTPTEERAISALRKLANRWPPTLRLFSWAGTLCVMDSSVEPSAQAVLAHVDGIPNDGGDPT